MKPAKYYDKRQSQWGSMKEFELKCPLHKAAPALLKACQAALSTIESEYPEPAMPSSRDMLVAAIAQATADPVPKAYWREVIDELAAIIPEQSECIRFEQCPARIVIERDQDWEWNIGTMNGTWECDLCHCDETETSIDTGIPSSELDCVKIAQAIVKAIAERLAP